MDLNTEIRKLSPGHLRQLVAILEYAESWKLLMEIIPKTLYRNNFDCVLSNENCAKYNSDHFRIIEGASANSHRRNSEILLDEWGTSGQIRPSLGHLLDLLKKAELFRAADYVAVDLLKLQPPPRPKNGPASSVETFNFEKISEFDNDEDKTLNNNIDGKSSKKGLVNPKIIITPAEVSDMIKFSTDSIITESVSDETYNSNTESDNLPKISALLQEQSGDNIPQISILMDNDSEISESSIETNNSNLPLFSDLMKSVDIQSSLPHFKYNDLESSTNNFDEDCDRFLGRGSFGSVYLADGLLNSQIAVKKLQPTDSSDEKLFKQFKTEIEILCNVCHDNLLPIRGFSCDGPAYCILYDYLPGGDLEKALKKSKESIIWSDRLLISYGICDAICYLHTTFDLPIIHRDIKSANILLTSQNRAKLCDFGVIKILNDKDINSSDSIIGTDVYMAPEVFRLGDVSEKSDIFSFGVVILELLTALSPFDSNRENADLISHVNDFCEDQSIEPLLDSSTGNWIKDEINYSNDLFSIALQCLEEKPKRLDNKSLKELLTKLCKTLK